MTPQKQTSHSAVSHRRPWEHRDAPAGCQVLSPLETFREALSVTQGSKGLFSPTVLRLTRKDDLSQESESFRVSSSRLARLAGQTAEPDLAAPLPCHIVQGEKAGGGGEGMKRKPFPRKAAKCINLL